MTVIGIDAGGTRTTGLIAGRDATPVRSAQSSGANLHSEGEAGVERVLRDLLASLLGAAGAEPVRAICAGMAGVSRPEDIATIERVLARLLPNVPAVVVSDALVALEAGTPRAAGIVLISGTGSIAYGRDAEGRTTRAGGWGYVLGDEGSGYWLGRNALRSVVRAADGRGDTTSMTGPVLAHHGVRTPTELVRAIAGAGAKPSAIAQLASIAGEAAEAGDPVARHLIDRGGEELAAAVASVARRLSLSQAPLWLSGGTLQGVAALRDATLIELARVTPGLKPEVLPVDPAIGAVRLALDLAAGTLSLPTSID